MDRYYYLVSQLPLLKFKERPCVDIASFLTESKKWLTNKDFFVLSQVKLDDFQYRKEDIKLVKEYKYFEKTLREEVASFRKTSNIAKKSDFLEFLKISLLEGSPLDIENNLLLIRWKFIEEKEKDHFCDLEAFVLYFLKLQILERVFVFDKEKGLGVFDALCEIKA